MTDRQNYFHEYIASVARYDAMEDMRNQGQQGCDKCLAEQEQTRDRMIADGYSEADAQYELERAYKYLGH
jgi:hypothetical protein